jgi:hypothetical protein
MTGRRWFTVLAVVIVVGSLGYAGFRAYRSSDADFCYACQRSIHAHMRTIAIANGRARPFCCPACALSEHEQEGKPIRITELTDFLTGAKLTPADVFLVKGSDVNMCAHKHELMEPDKREAAMAYDRCAPSLLAFSTEKDAARFAREHGGEVLPSKDVASALIR